MKTSFKVLVFLAFGSLIAPTVQAQYFNKKKHYITVGGKIGVANYFGDLAPKKSMFSTDLKLTRPSIFVTASYRFHPRISLRGSLGWVRIKGDDFTSANETDSEARFRYARNLHFRNDMAELTVHGVFDLLENRGTFLKRPQIVPYLFIGMGLFYHNPRAKTPVDYPGGSRWVSLQPLRTENTSYSLVQFVIPYGFGVRYKLTDRIDVGLEFGFRWTFTDYLDDVGGEYIDPNLLSSDLARVMSNRSGEAVNAANGKDRNLQRTLEDLGYNLVTVELDNGAQFTTIKQYAPGQVRGGSDNDKYTVVGAHITYIISGGVRCPKFR